MESDKKSTDMRKTEKTRMAEELAQKNVDENLSRPTHHDSNLTTGLNPAFDTALNQATTTNLGLPGTYISPNQTGGSIPITQENEFVSRNLGGIGAPLTGSQFVSGTQFTGTTIPQSNLASEIPITTSTGEVIEEEPHKKGFFSKVKGIFHHKKTSDTDLKAEEPVVVHEKHKKEKHIKDPYTEALRNEPGYLDEKGTTVSMPQGTQSNAQLGLPVWGPDYTHGTHGTTTHTVFTGGQTNIGLESNLATTSLPVPVEGLQSGFQPNLGTGFQPGLDTGIHKRGIDLSGANATHIDRDITLQEGGLLGLRQGAVTGNPGDIITNYAERGDLDLPETTTKYVQPVTQTFVQPITTTTVTTATFEQTMPEQLINVTNQHLGETGTGLGVGTCSLIKGSQNQNLNQNLNKF